MNADEVFLNILKENLLFMRHQETQRMWIANVFVAIVVGFLAFIGKNNLPEDAWYVYLAFIIISLLCLLITLKLNYVFNETKNATKKILKDKKVTSLGEDWKEYMLLLSSKGWWNQPLGKVSCLYIILYAIAAAGFLALWIVPHFCSP